MPLDTVSIDLSEEIDRLDGRLDELADAVAEAGDDADDDADVSDEVEEARRVEKHLAGLEWACSQWDDPSVTLGTLNTGEMGAVRDISADLKREKQMFGGEAGSIEGAATSVFIAAGVVDAPFVPTDDAGQPQNDPETLYPIVASDLLPQFSAWLEYRIDDLTVVDEGNVTPFAERLAARTSTAETE